jgi:hypothetical protein
MAAQTIALTFFCTDSTHTLTRQHTHTHTHTTYAHTHMHIDATHKHTRTFTPLTLLFIIYPDWLVAFTPTYMYTLPQLPRTSAH